MSNWYYYNKNGDKVGPITPAALKALAQQGLITVDTMIENGQGRTARAGEINGLFSVPPATPVPLMPQQPLSQTTETRGAAEISQTCPNSKRNVQQLFSEYRHVILILLIGIASWYFFKVGGLLIFGIGVAGYYCDVHKRIYPFVKKSRRILRSVMKARAKEKREKLEMTKTSASFAGVQKESQADLSPFSSRDSFSDPSPGQRNFSENELPGMNQDSVFMLMHLSQFFFAPISTIILWVMAKDKDSRADIHMKNIANAIISYTIYNIVVFIVMLIGMAIAENAPSDADVFAVVLCLPVALVAFFINIRWIVSVIKAAIKANKGEIMAYPRVIRFFKVDSFPVTTAESLPVVARTRPIFYVLLLLSLIALAVCFCMLLEP